MIALFATVVLDVDSTVSGIEGIDWLAERRGPQVAARVAALTNEAMRGVIPLEEVYGERIEAIRPSKSDIAELSGVYIERIAPDCAQSIARLMSEGVRVVLVSGGLRPAILPLAAHLGIGATDLHAVDVRFTESGEYADFERASPLATAAGKRTLVDSLRLPRPILAVGDGATDLAMRGAVDRFAAFTGFVSRPAVTTKADVIIDSFPQLLPLVLG